MFRILFKNTCTYRIIFGSFINVSQINYMLYHLFLNMDNFSNTSSLHFHSQINCPQYCFGHSQLSELSLPFRQSKDFIKMSYQPRNQLINRTCFSNCPVNTFINLNEWITSPELFFDCLERRSDGFMTTAVQCFVINGDGRT